MILSPHCEKGGGDIVAAGKMITDPRKEQVDFSDPTRTGVTAIVVTGPDGPPVARVNDLAGKEVYLWPSMTTPQGVDPLNSGLGRKGLPPVSSWKDMNSA